jgi:hypothetical protein
VEATELPATPDDPVDLFGAPSVCPGCTKGPKRNRPSYGGRQETYIVPIAWIPALEAYLCDECRDRYCAWITKDTPDMDREERNNHMPECVKAVMKAKHTC